MGKDSSAPAPPEPTAEELEIQNIILGQLRGGSEMQEMLMPYMMEEMGYRVVETGDPDRARALDAQIANIEAEMKQVSEESVVRDEYGRRIDSSGNLVSEKPQERYTEEIDRLKAEREQAGTPTRTIERIPQEERLAGMDPQERKAYELHDAYLDRQLSAIRGDLPISPALERSQQERRGLVTEDVSRRLGPQYKQSTAGIQTMAKLGESELIEQEQARQSIIGQGAGLIGGSQAGIMGGTQARTAGLQGVPQSYYSGTGAGGAALQPYQQQRGLQYQGQMQSGANRAAQQAGLMQLAGTAGMAYAMSSEEYKEDIKMVSTGEADDALDMVKNGNTYTYRYKKGLGQPKGKRIGLVTQDAPSEVVTPDGKMLDMPQELGLLRTATKALAKKVERMERRA